ncbi:hypothetical protein B5S32_g2248 [[Candida] boidinii]|nr:hypothetical protein B5S32_g2248 [[Candida] boidinii]
MSNRSSTLYRKPPPIPSSNQDDLETAGSPVSIRSNSEHFSNNNNTSAETLLFKIGLASYNITQDIQPQTSNQKDSTSNQKSSTSSNQSNKYQPLPSADAATTKDTKATGFSHFKTESTTKFNPRSTSNNIRHNQQQNNTSNLVKTNQANTINTTTDTKPAPIKIQRYNSLNRKQSQRSNNSDFRVNTRKPFSSNVIIPTSNYNHINNLPGKNSYWRLTNDNQTVFKLPENFKKNKKFIKLNRKNTIKRYNSIKKLNKNPNYLSKDLFESSYSQLLRNNSLRNLITPKQLLEYSLKYNSDKYKTNPYIRYTLKDVITKLDRDQQLKQKNQQTQEQTEIKDTSNINNVNFDVKLAAQQSSANYEKIPNYDNSDSIILLDANNNSNSLDDYYKDILGNKYGFHEFNLENYLKMKSEIDDYKMNQKLIKNQEIEKNLEKLRLEKESLQKKREIERQKRQELKLKNNSNNNNNRISLFSNLSNNNQNKNKSSSKEGLRISNPVIIEEDSYNSDNMNIDTGNNTKTNDNHKLLRYKNLNLSRGSLSRRSGSMRTNTGKRRYTQDSQQHQNQFELPFVPAHNTNNKSIDLGTEITDFSDSNVNNYYNTSFLLNDDSTIITTTNYTDLINTKSMKKFKNDKNKFNLELKETKGRRGKINVIDPTKDIIGKSVGSTTAGINTASSAAAAAAAASASGLGALAAGITSTGMDNTDINNRRSKMGQISIASTNPNSYSSLKTDIFNKKFSNYNAMATYLNTKVLDETLLLDDFLWTRLLFEIYLRRIISARLASRLGVTKSRNVIKAYKLDKNEDIFANVQKLPQPPRHNPYYGGFNLTGGGSFNSISSSTKGSNNSIAALTNTIIETGSANASKSNLTNYQGSKAKSGIPIGTATDKNESHSGGTSTTITPTTQVNAEVTSSEYSPRENIPTGTATATSESQQAVTSSAPRSAPLGPRSQDEPPHPTQNRNSYSSATDLIRKYSQASNATSKTESITSSRRGTYYGTDPARHSNTDMSTKRVSNTTNRTSLGTSVSAGIGSVSSTHTGTVSNIISVYSHLHEDEDNDDANDNEEGEHYYDTYPNSGNSNSNSNGTSASATSGTKENSNGNSNSNSNLPSNPPSPSASNSNSSKDLEEMESMEDELTIAYVLEEIWKPLKPFIAPVYGEDHFKFLKDQNK